MKTVLKARSDPIWFCEEVMGQSLFPKQKEIIREFYQNRYDARLPQKKYLIIVAGMRSGKTLLASLVNAYEFFNTITLENPAKHYGLAKIQPIFLTTVATSSTLAEDGIFYNLVNYIEGSEWFNTWVDLRIKEDRIAHDKKDVICQVLGSWTTTMAGRSNIFVCADELDLFEQATQGKRSGHEVFTTLRNSTVTFGDDGHVMAISSPKLTNGVVMKLYHDYKDDPRAVTRIIPTWEMNPHYTKESLMLEHKNQSHTFWRDFGCKPELAGGMAFPEKVKLLPMVNVLKSDYVPPQPVMRVMAIDPAVKNDAFGLACGYKDYNGDIIIDGVRNFKKLEGDPLISPKEVEGFIYDKIPKLNINYFVFDTWMFPNIIENIRLQFGIEPEKHVVSKEDYDRWRGLQNTPGDYRLHVVQDDELEKEVNDLIIKSGESIKPKVDHQVSGSKDMADCVANCIWYLTDREMEVLLPNTVAIKLW
jgi:hypothetical protein